MTLLKYIKQTVQFRCQFKERKVLLKWGISI